MSDYQDLMELSDKAQGKLMQCRFSQLRMSYPMDRLNK